MDLQEHPTVRRHRDRPSTAAAPPLSMRELRAVCLASGADDAGCVAIGDPALDDQRASILEVFPRTKSLVSLVVRMNRENVRTPLRSVSNAEFHHGRDVADAAAHAIVAALERRGIPAVNPPMAFPMEMDRFPGRSWSVSHKPVAVAAGLGRVGIHRNVIHPRFGNFILLATVLLSAEFDEYSQPLDYNPCLECKLCVAACPTGAIEPDGSFNFGACYTHNYRDFMSGFSDWVETVAESGSAKEYRARVDSPETLSMWQSLAFGPNYKAAYCLSVCPAGEDVIGPFLENRGQFLADVVRPLQDRVETIYVTPGSDAEGFVKKRFKNKRTKIVSSGLRVRSIPSFLFGMSLLFQRQKAKKLSATYHLTFTGREQAETTVRIDRGTLTVTDGLVGKADLRIAADAKAWIDFINKDVPLAWLLLSGKIRPRGPLRLFVAFGTCFSS